MELRRDGFIPETESAIGVVSGFYPRRYVAAADHKFIRRSIAWHATVNLADVAGLAGGLFSLAPFHGTAAGKRSNVIRVCGLFGVALSGGWVLHGIFGFMG